MKNPKEDVDKVVTVNQISMNRMQFYVVGTSPLMPHAMSAKAAGNLLFPPPKKTQAEKATSMKHEPYEEFRDAAYQFQDTDDQPTRLYMPGSCFHSALAAVAIDMAGAKKSQIGRLTSIPSEKVQIWGIPKIRCSIVRSSDMNRTADVRTLPILPQWAATFEVDFVGSLIKEQSLVNLLAAAGIIVGIGDGRPQKGKLSFGRFRLCNEDDPEYLHITKFGRKMQDAALRAPEFYDTETKRLLNWFDEERTRRSAAPIQAPRNKDKSKGKIEIAAMKKKENGKEKRRSAH